MGRKKKITDVPVSLLKFEKMIEGSAVTQKNSLYDFISWGQKNNYPDILLSLYNASPTHHSCISFETIATVGGGIDYQAMQLDGSQTFPNYSESWDNLLRSITLDYFIYNTFAVQLIKNKDNKTYSFWQIPMDKVRCSEFDEDGQITRYAISNDWSKLAMNPPIWLDAVDMRDSESIERGKPYIYVYRSYSPTMEYYSAPLYQAGIKAIQAEIEYLNYDLRTTVNNFVPSGMLVLPEVETDDQRREVINNVQRMFTSSENANSVMISFRSNVEESKPEFIPFQANSTNVNLYADANNRTINRILAAHQIPNASLIGLPDVNGSGFASEAAKLETAFNLWNLLSGNSHRNAIVGSLNAMFRLNGIDTEIVLKPLRFTYEQTSDETTAAEKNQDVSTDNIEEKVTE